MTDDALLRQYEELKSKEKDFGGKGKKDKPLYDNMADELLDDLNQHEKDLNDMMKYLSEVEDLIKSQDLNSIKQMMDVTKDTMSQHFVAYDKFKDQIDLINSQADAAISSLNFYNTPDQQQQTSHLAVVKKPLKKKTTTVLERVREEPASDTSSDGNLDSSSDEDNEARVVSKKSK